MLLLKSHGLGNDYLVVDEASAPLTPEVAIALCDRNRGIGADGVLEPGPSTRATVTATLRIWNPDGSQAEKSGNGLRIFAHWLVNHREAPCALSIEVAGSLVSCLVEGDQVTVNMGAASFEPGRVPAVRHLVREPVDVCGVSLEITAVGLGNPHCVVFVEDDLDGLPWRDWGSWLETCALFPNRTNVQVARIHDGGRIEARIWERGAGETQSSGSSACAVAAVAHHLGWAQEDIRIHMPGGALSVEIGTDGTMQLRGPVQEIGKVRLCSDFEKRIGIGMDSRDANLDA
ncbi:MAG: diaminopimelate epimerase [Myxococcota bacterium]|nr:diaminopimelate epimerase [Myxococcota bacterium]